MVNSGERTHLPPMWPGFDSQSPCHIWVEFVGSLLCSGARFSKDPKTLRARKAIHKTPTDLFYKAGLFICCKGNKN